MCAPAYRISEGNWSDKQLRAYIGKLNGPLNREKVLDREYISIIIIPEDSIKPQKQLLE